MKIRSPLLPGRQRGMGIVETMVGILIGMVVVLAVYNVFALAEGYKRTTVGVADAQTTGLFAQFILAREIGNAGNGLSSNGHSSAPGDLAKCKVLAATNWPDAFGAGTAIRPIPVLIQDGGPNASDQIVVTYGTPSRIVSSVLVQAQIAAPGDSILVQSPNGFRLGDRIIVSNSAGKCQLTRINAAVAKPDINGQVVLTVSPSVTTTAPVYATGGIGGARVTNLGCDGNTPPDCGPGSSVATRTLFDVASNQLRTTDLFGGAPAVPIAQNVVLLKAQYGVDCANNGVIVWTSATASGTCGHSYAPADFFALAAGAGNPYIWTADELAKIRAIRIAIVVRSDEPDLKDAALFGQKATLFDCSTHDAACQGAIAIDKTVLTDGWRHRTYETIVPMRNAIYNNGKV